MDMYQSFGGISRLLLQDRELFSTVKGRINLLPSVGKYLPNYTLKRPSKREESKKNI
jgi:hypothetical protein